ncbi:MAG: ribbon-helix-helix protein, CopG family [Clostridia bacterium]|jgi:RHH-type transcriptional regulator, rel operon repressor / antitoxin RelB|nr:ribbon-helix-helix protein, CopG family [Clostridia bacterium]MBT7121749.1 ribbon-helix-helix protein, CopG family [Clostridia bacterium]
MALSLRLSEDETRVIKDYAQMQNKSVSEVMRQAIMEKIETEVDLKIYNKEMAEYKKTPVSYSHEDVKKILELD